MQGFISKEDKTALNFTVRNTEDEILNDPNRIRPEFYEDFEDIKGMTFHNGAGLKDGKVRFVKEEDWRLLQNSF